MSYCKLGPMTWFFFFFRIRISFDDEENKNKKKEEKKISRQFIFASWKILKAEVYADISRDPTKWWAWEYGGRTLQDLGI